MGTKAPSSTTSMTAPGRSSRKRGLRATRGAERPPEILVSLSKLALAASDIDELMQAVVQGALAGLGVSLADLWLSTTASETLTLAACCGRSTLAKTSYVVPANHEAYPGWMLRQLEPIVVRDAAQDPRMWSCQLLREEGVVSSVIVPIRASERTHALLGAHTATARAFSRADADFLVEIGRIFAAALGWHERREDMKEKQRHLLASIVRDICERRDVEHALRRSEQRYRALQLQHTELERVAVAGEMAGIVAHEIRTPLNALSINIQLLERTLRRAEFPMGQAQELLQTVHHEIERINGLLEDYLKLVRRPPSHTRHAISLSQAVQDTIRFVEPKAHGSHVTIEVTLAPEVRVLHGDEDQLRQVLLNLLLNAIQAMPEGGTVYVSTAPSQDGVKLAIRDTGCGIDPKILPRVFQPFVTTKEHGTGLGLAISQRLVREMGGRIHVSSKAGEGTCFEVLLPEAASEADLLASETVSAGPSPWNDVVDGTDD